MSEKKGPRANATHIHSAFKRLPQHWQDRSQTGRACLSIVMAHLLVDLLQEQQENGCSLTMPEIIKRFKAAGFTPSDAHSAVQTMTKFEELLLEVDSGQMHVAFYTCEGGEV
jgi:hypothetical protein